MLSGIVVPGARWITDAMVLACKDNTVRLLPFRAKKSRILCEHATTIVGLSVLRKNEVVSGSQDGRIKLSRRKDGTTIAIGRHAPVLTCLATLPERQVVSGGTDGTVRLWDTRTRKYRTVLRHEGIVCSVMVIDERAVVSCGEDGVVQVWDQFTDKVRTILDFEKREESWELAAASDGLRTVFGSEFHHMWSLSTAESSAVNISAIIHLSRACPETCLGAAYTGILGST